MRRRSTSRRKARPLRSDFSALASRKGIDDVPPFSGFGRERCRAARTLPGRSRETADVQRTFRTVSPKNGKTLINSRQKPAAGACGDHKTEKRNSLICRDTCPG
jgi:hypothetical protein